MNGVSTKDPFLSADGGVLYFARSDDGVAQQIYRAQVTATNSFAAPEPVRGLPGIQTNPVESSDGVVLYFGAAPDVDASLSGLNDIWGARASDGGFTAPARVDELNSPEDDTPVWLSPDLCRLYFSSSRGHAGNRDIWLAERQPR